MSQPARLVAAGWIAMGPMYHPALRMPFVYAIEINSVTHIDRTYPGCEVNIVSNQQGLA